MQPELVDTMDESRKRDVSTANAKNISSPLDEDFGNDFLSSWKLPKSGKGTIDFNVDPVPKSSKKFNFNNLDDFGLDGAFDKLPSFKMGMSDLDFSSPLKKKVKHNNSIGDDLSEGKKEIEKDNFSFSFDFNELGKFSLDAKLGIEEKSTSKVDPVSSEGNMDTQRDLSGTAVLEDNNTKDKPRTHGVCTLRPPHPKNHESMKNTSLPAPNDSSDKIQEHTSVNPATMEQTKVDSVPNGNYGEHRKEIYPTKAAVNTPFQNFSCSAQSCEDPVLADRMNSKDDPIADSGKVGIPRESNGHEQSIGSQSRDTSTIDPNVLRRPVSQFDSRNEVVEESVSLNEGSQGNQNFSDVPQKFLKKTTCGTKNTDEGTSGHKSLSSSIRRKIRNVKPALENERGSFSFLSKSANTKASRVELTSETDLNQLSGASKVMKKLTTHPTDLKRWEHKQANAGLDKSKTALPKIYSKLASHGLLSTSSNAKGDRNAIGLEPPSSGNSSLLNAQNSTGHSTGHKIVANDVLLKRSVASDSLQVAPSKDNKMSTISELTGTRKSPQTVPGLRNETVSIMKILKTRKYIYILGSGTPKAHVDNAISSCMTSEMGDISDLELPMLLENDGNLEKAEGCRKELEDICILLKRKHAEAKELAVRAIVNNNTMLMLNHPMFEDKIS
nr:unnamed protein product [Digitaria exilis]